MELIQGVIARLAGNGFLVKGWAITLAAALIGFALNANDASLAATSLPVIVAFWIVDTSFLRSERIFRAFYSYVANDDERIAAFQMNATRGEFKTILASSGSEDRKCASWIDTAARPTISCFYGALALANGLVILILSLNQDGSRSSFTEALLDLLDRIANALRGIL